MGPVGEKEMLVFLLGFSVGHFPCSYLGCAVCERGRLTLIKSTLSVCQFTIYIISSFVMSAMVHERLEKLQRRVDGYSGYKDEDAFDYMVG